MIYFVIFVTNVFQTKGNAVCLLLLSSSLFLPLFSFLCSQLKVSQQDGLPVAASRHNVTIDTEVAVQVFSRLLATRFPFVTKTLETPIHTKEEPQLFNFNNLIYL